MLSLPFVQSLKVLVRSWTAHVDYFAMYSATVKHQRGDDTLDLKPVSDSMPAMVSVPIRIGIPGVKVKVLPGAQVLFGWENGDPQRPFAALWSSDSLQSITINASNSCTVNAPGSCSISTSSCTINSPDITLGGPGATSVALAIPTNANFAANAAVWTGFAAGLASNPGPLTGVGLGAIMAPLLATYAASLAVSTPILPSYITKSL